MLFIFKEAETLTYWANSAKSPLLKLAQLILRSWESSCLMLESFFGIPGLGNVSLNALHSSDMAVVRAVVILGALLYQGVNLVTDLCYVWLDPRVRVG